MADGHYRCLDCGRPCGESLVCSARDCVFWLEGECHMYDMASEETENQRAGSASGAASYLDGVVGGFSGNVENGNSSGFPPQPSATHGSSATNTQVTYGSHPTWVSGDQNADGTTLSSHQPTQGLNNTWNGINQVPGDLSTQPLRRNPYLTSNMPMTPNLPNAVNIPHPSAFHQATTLNPSAQNPAFNTHQPAATLPSQGHHHFANPATNGMVPYVPSILSNPPYNPFAASEPVLPPPWYHQTGTLPCPSQPRAFCAPPLPPPSKEEQQQQERHDQEQEQQEQHDQDQDQEDDDEEEEDQEIPVPRFQNGKKLSRFARRSIIFHATGRCIWCRRGNPDLKFKGCPRCRADRRAERQQRRSAVKARRDLSGGC